LEFLHQVRDQNIINMEMESLAFAALTHHAGIRAAVICVTLLNRLHGDQVASSKEVLNEWQNLPQELVARYIKKHLGMTGPVPRPPPPGPKTVVNTKKMTIVREESQSYE
jgi:uridine phosphorylase